MEKALLQFLADVRAACDRCESALKKHPLQPQLHSDAPKTRHKERICLCGHVESEHDEEKGCKACHRDRTLGALGCPEFRPGRRKHALKPTAKSITPHVMPLDGAGSLPPCERAILAALVMYGPRTTKELAVLTRYSASSGGFGTALAYLRGENLITRTAPAEITQEGRKTIGHVEPLPSGKKLIEHWKEKLGPCEAAILDCLSDGTRVSLEDLAEVTRYSPSSGGFGSALAKLRKLKLIERGWPTRLAKELFE